MAKRTLMDFYAMKASGERLAWTTAYDCCFAAYAERAGVDMLLVGDSLGIFVYGMESTDAVTMDMMLAHCRAVRNGAKNTYIVADMPFGSYITPETAVANAVRFIKEAGADAVKLEGGSPDAAQMKAICDRGITLFGHVGMPPRPVCARHTLEEDAELAAAKHVIRDARDAYRAGVGALLLENMPDHLCAHLHETLPVPVYSAGSGPHADGHVIAHGRILGMKDIAVVSRKYRDISETATEGLSRFVHDVKTNGYEALSFDKSPPSAGMRALLSTMRHADTQK